MELELKILWAGIICYVIGGSLSIAAVVLVRSRPWRGCEAKSCPTTRASGKI